MFAKIFKNLYSKFSFKSRMLITTSIFTFAYTKYKSSISLDVKNNKKQYSQEQLNQISSKLQTDVEEYIKQLKEVIIGDAKDIKQNQKMIVTVKDVNGKPYEILVIRIYDKLYAISATCPYREPFESSEQKPTLNNAVFFNDKLFCPHHGCVFNITSGSVEHGPCLENLPIFSVDERTTKIKLTYPSILPVGVLTNFSSRDAQDLRKVVIMGGDDHATMGNIIGLRRYQFDGQITVIKQDSSLDLPLRDQYLHKSILNFNLDKKALHERSKREKKQAEEQALAMMREKAYLDDQQSKILKGQTENSNNLFKSPQIKKKQKKLKKKTIQQQINDLIQQKVYSKLNFLPAKWYQDHDIEFIYTSETYRIINKRFYPYLTFPDGTKIQFDGLLIATGVASRIPKLQNLTVFESKDNSASIAENVFSPIRSKSQHNKLIHFLNRYAIQKIIVHGLNIQSLEFVENIIKEFPNMKVTVLDQLESLATVQIFGPDISQNILKEFTQKGVQFYVKLTQTPRFANKFSIKKVLERNNQIKALQTNKKKSKTTQDNDEDNIKKYSNAIEARITPEVTFNADCAVLFPHQFEGNTKNAKNGKYTDYDFNADGLITADQFQRTENIRIFSAGASSHSQYYLYNKKVWTFNPNICFEQGFISALNMQALRIPFYYVPYQKFNFFEKKLFYVGTKQYYNQMAIIGSVQNWDFVAIYANGMSIVGASASSSKARQLNILREAFRLNCAPQFQDIVNGVWTLPNLANLIRKLNKSGCYKDLIFQNIDHVNKKDLIWMERTANAGYENDRPFMAEQMPQFEVGKDGLLKQL